MGVLVQVRDVDRRVRDELKARAARAGVSFNSYLRGLLEAATEVPDQREVLERLVRRPDRSAVSSSAVIRADRDARSAS